MREMKSSGIEWIGQVPKSWDVEKLKYSFEKHFGGAWGLSAGQGETDSICVRVADFNYPHLSVNYNDNMTIRSYDNKVIESFSIVDGDILLEKSGGGEQTPVGRSVLHKGKNAMCANFIECLRPNEDNDSRFLNYWLYSSYQNGYSKRNIKQTTGIQNLDITALLSETIAVPVIDEQIAIADYLDEKCADIDKIIATKKKTNELLKERRQSIITEAVTKGLNPNVEMKDSGIEWIGYVPNNWSVKKIKHNFTVLSGATPKTSINEYWEGDIPWITPADYKTEDVYIDSTNKKITFQGLNSCATSIIPKNNLIFSKRAPVGLVAINSISLCTNQGCLACVSNNEVSTKYYYYCMSVFTDEFEMFACGTTFKEISYDAFVNFVLPCPELEEQMQIADYLDEKCDEINKLIESNNKTIEKLQEYRKSIIFEAVTGKTEID